jgi:hypothetical protein
VYLDRETKPHEWIIIDNSHNQASMNMGGMYRAALERAQHDLVLFVHPDAFLPFEWEHDAYEKLQQLEAHDPEWGVVGFAGVALGARRKVRRGAEGGGQRQARRDTKTTDCSIASMETYAAADLHCRLAPLRLRCVQVIGHC